MRFSRLHKVCPLLHIPLLYNFKESGITVSNLKFPATVGMSIFDIQKKGRFLVFLLTFKNLPQNHSQFWYQITRLRPDQQSEYQISKAEIFWVFDLVFFRLRSILCSRTSKCPWSPIAPFNWRQHRFFSTHIWALLHFCTVSSYPLVWEVPRLNTETPTKVKLFLWVLPSPRRGLVLHGLERAFCFTKEKNTNLLPFLIQVEISSWALRGRWNQLINQKLVSICQKFLVCLFWNIHNRNCLKAIWATIFPIETVKLSKLQYGLCYLILCFLIES